MNKMFPEHRGKIYSGPRQPVEILQHIMMDGYNEVVFLVGSDRFLLCSSSINTMEKIFPSERLRLNLLEAEMLTVILLPFQEQDASCSTCW
ncbi:MAG: hypothetical protein CM15mV3_1600 [Caudoviricetes sp.]|nr:MAG: hypothetical protein CM15mV3_1600 [Caudoviricetes sp.]